MIFVYLAYGFAAATFLFALAAYAVKSRRGPLVWAAISAAAAAASAQYQVFWTMAVFALMIPWALVAAGEWIDMAWRMKTGLCLSILLACGLSLYPTYMVERFGPVIDPELPKEQIAELEAQGLRGDSGFPTFLRLNVPFRVVRGLDLKGGFRVEYTVDVQEAIKDKRDRYFDDIRAELAKALGLAKAEGLPTVDELSALGQRVKVEKPREEVDRIIITFQSEEDAAKLNDAFLKRFVQELTVLRGVGPRGVQDKLSTTFTIKQETEAEVRKKAVEQAKEKILSRVDSLGLKEASVSTRDEDIVVEVPGENRREFEEIKEIIGQTARLEFKMLDDEADFFKDMAAEWRQNQRADISAEGIRFATENAPLGPGKTDARWFAVRENQKGESRTDALKKFKAWVQAQTVIPDTHEVAFGKEYDRTTGEETGWRTYYLFGRAEITGDMIREAQAGPEQSQSGLGGWQVNLIFTPLGSDRFEAVTGQNINKRFAIILDEKVESSPVIQGKIAGGSARITMGAGSVEQQLADAKKLELVLRSGALPAPIEFKGEQQVGPSLGSDAIAQGVKGAAVGTTLVFLLMLVIYSRAGAIAILAVIFNLVIQVAVLAMFGAAMTLPGIAGLALTIGIAVDANVLINERIRDELRGGKSPRQAVDIGYDKAFSAILDGHVTTVISGLILSQFGSGPIKGFANALIIGMVTSMFTGVLCTRLGFDWAVRWRKVKKLSLG